jgi:dihydroorotate dehydrogenase electron transfer subunit
VSLKDESPTVRTLILDLDMIAEPGQFVMAWLPGIGEKPFSLVRDAPATLTVARVGPFSEAIHALTPGDRLWLRGPLGRGFTLPFQPKCGLVRALLLIAGGYGVAPLRFFAEHALAEGWEVTTVIGGRTAEDLIFIDPFQEMGARVETATEDGSHGFHGLVTAAAKALLDSATFQALYGCGPEPMLNAAERLARAHELPFQLSYERTMRCGFGVCGSCARQGWLVCRDGPVRAGSQ